MNYKRFQTYFFATLCFQAFSLYASSEELQSALEIVSTEVEEYSTSTTTITMYNNGTSTEVTCYKYPEKREPIKSIAKYDDRGKFVSRTNYFADGRLPETKYRADLK